MILLDLYLNDFVISRPGVQVPSGAPVIISPPPTYKYGGGDIMYRTRICDKCDNNKFLVVPEGTAFKVQCSECGNVKETFELDGKMIVHNCGKCGSSLFKFREKQKENSIEIDFVCSSCGERASYIYIDDEGREVTLEKRAFLDMKNFIANLNDRLYNIEFGVNSFNDLGYGLIDSEQLAHAVNSVNNELSSIKNEVEGLEARISKLDINSME
jgi:predicted  nucleic acid-binding Zn-ribbon protein